MTLLNVERIKLFSTRSPYWCLAAIAVAALGFATLFGLVENGDAAIPYLFLRGVGLGMSIYMVLAALAVTTEYRFGTIRNTFLGVPRRPRVLLAKTVLLALIGAVVGLLAALDRVLQRGDAKARVFVVQHGHGLLDQFDFFEADAVSRLSIDAAPKSLELLLVEVGVERVFLGATVVADFR